MRSAIVLFTRDLRVHDHPALAAAAREAERVTPLFVLDDAIVAPPNRLAFLLESLADLDASLRGLGSRLVVRRGETVAEVARVAAETAAEAVFLSADVTAFAQRREARLAARIEVRSSAGATVVPPGDVTPASRDHFLVFTPYWRRWREEPWRAIEAPPTRLLSPGEPTGEPLPAPEPHGRLRGGETAGRARLDAWLHDGVARYDAIHDDLAADATSRLSPYLHLGCVSPLEVAARARELAGAEPFVRQLCWRDFYCQLLAARPELARDDLRSRRSWTDDPEALAAWKAGRTGVPIVDAGMRQLAAEGWMHNRARLITGSFLTKHLGIDWREGARHYAELLLDGDVASNAGNWQWVAGTGTDARPGRLLSPLRQAARFDPQGVYVRRHVPELAAIEDAAVHEPWKLGGVPGYPAPIVDLAAARDRFLAS